MSFVVLDTDVASRSFQGRLPSPIGARLTGLTTCISVITRGELIKWTQVRDWGPRRRAALMAWCEHTVVLDITADIADQWGAMQALAHKRGRPRPVNDSWIAATCITEGVPLATFNHKDYADHVALDGLILLPS